MNTQSNIEFYHGTLKRSLNADVRELRGRRVDWLLWCLSNSISNHYIYLMERKFNGFVVNKSIEDILRKNILKSRDIMSTYTVPPTYLDGSWKVKSLYTIFFMRLIDHILNSHVFRARGIYVEIFVSIDVSLYYKIPIFPKILFLHFVKHITELKDEVWWLCLRPPFPKNFL